MELDRECAALSKRFFGTIGSMFIMIGQTLRACVVGKWRWRLLFDQIASVGVSSQPVVLITGAFTGAVLEAQSLYQLSAVKMETLGGAVVAVGMLRELGPVITGLMLAGRVGSAMAAELGTMKVTEQIDALRSMSVDPVDYLVKPRIQAMFISIPILMVESVLVGVIASFVIAVGPFQVNPSYWMQKMTEIVAMGDLIVALVKAAAFGLIIGFVSCREGLNTSNGAVGVGKSTMRAMVYSAVILLVVNFMLTLILNYFFPMGSSFIKE